MIPSRIARGRGASPRNPSAAELELQHGRLVRLVASLAREVAGRAVGRGDVTWEEVLWELEQHLAAEDRLLDRLESLPPYHRARIAVLRGDHACLRGILSDLGPLMRIEVIRPTILDDLALALHDHVRREERVVYRWLEGQAAEALPPRSTSIVAGTE